MSEPNPANPDPTSAYPAYRPYGQQPWGDYQASQPYPAPQPAAVLETTSSMYPGPPHPKSMLWLWLTLGAVVLILFTATVAGVYFLADVGTPKSAAPAPAAQSGSPAPAAAIKLAVPAKLVGYPKLTDRKSQQLETEMHKAISSSGMAEQVVSGAYGNLKKHQLRLFVAVKMSIPQPDDFIKGTAESLGKNLGIKKFAPVPAGPLGGAATCGDTRKDGAPITMCVWADHGSFGLVAFFGQKVSAVTATFVQARGQIESTA